MLTFLPRDGDGTIYPYVSWFPLGCSRVFCWHPSRCGACIYWSSPPRRSALHRYEEHYSTVVVVERFVSQRGSISESWESKAQLWSSSPPHWDVAVTLDVRVAEVGIVWVRNYTKPHLWRTWAPSEVLSNPLHSSPPRHWCDRSLSYDGEVFGSVLLEPHWVVDQRGSMTYWQRGSEPSWWLALRTNWYCGRGRIGIRSIRHTWPGRPAIVSRRLFWSNRALGMDVHWGRPRVDSFDLSRRSSGWFPWTSLNHLDSQVVSQS